MKILAVGDIVSQPGLDTVNGLLRNIRKQYGIDFVIANGENASGVGIFLHLAQMLLHLAITCFIKDKLYRIWTTVRIFCARQIRHRSSRGVDMEFMTAWGIVCL